MESDLSSPSVQEASSLLGGLPGVGAHSGRELLADLLVRQRDVAPHSNSHSTRHARLALADGSETGRGWRNSLT